jgi:hypothetical protein
MEGRVVRQSDRAVRMRKLSVSRISLAAALSLVVAAPALAQSAGNGFLFHRPYVRVGVRGGYAFARAGSDLFDFTTEQLTLNKKDFSGLSVGGSVAFAVAERLDLMFDAGYSRAQKGSEFRDLVDNNRLPIEQRTTFERVPFTVNLKYYLTAPGQSIGTAVWIPAKITPWIGAGGGLMKYRFTQDGDFVDFNNNDVFNSTFETVDYASVFQGMAGVDYSLTTQLALTTEARLLYGKGQLDEDFGGFSKLDLSGVSASVGLSFRF